MRNWIKGFYIEFDEAKQLNLPLYSIYPNKKGKVRYDDKSGFLFISPYGCALQDFIDRRGMK